MLHHFGPESDWPRQDLIAFSDEFDAYLALAAYRSGVFPMPLLEGDHPTDMGWWSPMQRGILPPGQLKVSRSLRKSARRYTTTVDAAFEDVMARCADPVRDGGWITDPVIEVYTYFHQRNVAHSVETWDEQGRLVGGLYGVSVGGLFSGESMFHDDELGVDASKVALVRLVQELTDGVDPAQLDDVRLLDVQWLTPHLATLGAIEVARTTYLARLERVLTLKAPAFHRGPEHRRSVVPVPAKGEDHA